MGKAVDLDGVVGAVVGADVKGVVDTIGVVSTGV